MSTLELVVLDLCNSLESDLNMSEPNGIKHTVEYKYTIEKHEAMGGEKLVARIIVDDVTVIKVESALIDNLDIWLVKENALWFLLERAFSMGIMEFKRQISERKEKDPNS